MKINKKIFNYKCLSICVALFSVLQVKAQTNYVPNFDFSEGRNQPSCTYDYCKGGPGDIETDIYYWFNATVHSKCRHKCNAFFRECPTADWIDDTICDQGMGVPYSNSIRYVGMLLGDNKYVEGVGIRLAFKLPAGKYIVRFKVASREVDAGKTMKLNVNLTKYETAWHSRKKGNTHMWQIATFDNNSKPYQWNTVIQQFEVSQNKSGEMDVLTIVREDIGEQSGLYVDQVELYQYCPSLILFQNRHFDMVDINPYEAEIIKAGANYLNWWPSGDVIVEDTMTVTKFKASKEVVLKSGFSVERGGRFRAWIAPCSLPCPFPLADAGKDTTVCGRNCITIGGLDRYLEYEWSATPEGAIQYLSSTTTSSATFYPPIGAGRIRYKVKATNQCNFHWSDDIIVDYDSDPDPNPYFTVSNLDLSDTLNFDISMSPHTETIKVEIMTCDNLLLETYEYDNGDDFNCCNFHFSVDKYFSSCLCYKVKISTKNYCYNNWKDTVIDWTRNSTYNFISYSNFACKNILTSWKGYLNIVVKGAIWFNVEIKDRDDYTQFNYTGICDEDTIALWHPDVAGGVYFVNLFVYDCNNVPHFYTFPFEVFDQCQMKWELDEWSRPETDAFGQISLYPNPSSGFIIIKGMIDKSSKKLEMRIYDMFGHLVKDENIWNDGTGLINSKVELSSLGEGIYFVSLKNNGVIETKRIILIK